MSRRTGPGLPTGTITFLFTDIEGSTSLVRELGTERFRDVLDQHGRVLRAAFDAHDGYGVGTEGDSFFYVFRIPANAVAAAALAQKALAAHTWPHGATVRVRMGMHTGEGTLAGADSGSDYVGFDVHRAARIATAGHGGQVLVSETTRALVSDRLPLDVTLRDLGEHRFKDLARAERVYQVVVAGLPATHPRLKSLDRTPNNLPTQVTSFIGRSAEVKRGAELLAGTRLLTLTGPGGTGKTRLSLQIAAAAADEFPDGIYFVALAAIVDPEVVIPTIAHELGLQPAAQRAPLAQLVDHLRGKRLLLVLDNFEQILPAASHVAELIREPGLKVIVSSRAALRIYGEQEYPVPPLALPDLRALPAPEQLSQYEAVRLFVERALAVKPDFAVTNENAPAVAGICTRLDGLPLAIELAAARVRLLSPAAIYARLEKSAGVLGAGPRDLPARQQTLRGAISWSYDLLDDAARKLFRTLSCFAGGAALAEIEAVYRPDTAEAAAAGGDVLEATATLVDQSLVRQHEAEGEPRFFMLQTIREYGLERLGESADAGDIRRRHADAYLAIAERAVPLLMGPRRKVLLDRLEVEIDNLRGAIDWAASTGAVTTALRLVAAVWRLWQTRGYLQEGRAVVERILALPGVDDHPELLGQALEAAGGVAYWQGDLPAAGGWYDRGLDLARQRGDRLAIANAGYNRFFAYRMATADKDVANALVEESLRLYRELGDLPGIAKSLWGRANANVVSGDFESARRDLDQCIPTFRAQADHFGLAWALFLLAIVARSEGSFSSAHEPLEESLRIFAQADDVAGLTFVLKELAGLEAAEGHVERAMRLAGASAKLQNTSGAALAAVADEIFQTSDPSSKKWADDADASTAWAAGMAMTAGEAVAYALGRQQGAADPPAGSPVGD